MKVYINGTPAANLKQNDDGVEFTYLDSYLQSSTAVPFSLALPLDYETYTDRSVRPIIQALGIDMNQEYISPIGGISLAPAQHTTYTEINITDCETQIKSQLLAVPDHKLLSIHNYQPTLKASIIDGEFFEATPAEHNTHTLKCDLYDFEDLVGNEIFVSLLAYNLGISVPMISRVHLGDIPALIMDRPDRLAPQDTLTTPTKVHHETFATALSSQFLTSKRHHATTVDSIFDLIRTYSQQPALDCRTLLRGITLCLLSGCDDFSLEQQLIELKPNNTCSLSVLSGFVSADIYENTTKTLLDYLFGIQHISALKQTHIADLSRRIQINDKYLTSMILDYCMSLPKITREIFEAYPSIKSSVTVKIAKLIETRCQLIRGLLEAKKQETTKRRLAI